MTDLKREVTRFKESEAQSGKYIADLEVRLSRADESILSLQQNVETLEKECDRRREEVETMQARLETFRLDGESWRSDLETREAKVKQLEEKMQEWEQKRKEAGDTRARLGEVVGEVESASRTLRIDISKASSAASSPISERPPASPLKMNGDSTPSTPPNSELESQLLSLQQTHTATLADLSSVSAKYRDALREISDLAAQIQEAKLSNPSIAEVSTESPITDLPQEIPPFKRRIASPRSRDTELQSNSAGRRLFFRQAASSESLHARSLSQSQSLSQELSSARSRKASFSSAGGSSHSPSSSHSISYTHSYSNSLQVLGLRPNLSLSTPTLSPGHERSVSSLEKEIMRLQEVLKEREAEITLLEESFKGTQQYEKPVVNGIANDQDRSEMNGNPAESLSPKTLYQFDNIRKTMENGNGHAETASSYSDDESLERLNELMLYVSFIISTIFTLILPQFYGAKGITTQRSRRESQYPT